MNSDILPITLEQQKLISSAIRIKILHLLAEAPRTAKQVADVIGETPGNVHYHVQKLVSGKLIDLVETREVGGIVEKYYQSKGTRFRLADADSQTVAQPLLRSRMVLTEEQVKQVFAELEQVFHKWERNTAASQEPNASEVELTVHATFANKASDDGAR